MAWTTMDLSGEHLVPAPREKVWQALNNVAVLKSCIPGCEELVRVSDRELSIRLLAKIGTVRAPFTGRLVLADLDPPASYTISGQGQGGNAGFAKGASQVTLSPHGVDTRVAYKARLDVGGKLATMGNLQAVAAQVADEFFARLGRSLSTPAAAHAGRSPAPLNVAEGVVSGIPVGGVPRDAAPPLAVGGEPLRMVPVVPDPPMAEEREAPASFGGDGWPTMRTIVVAGGLAFYVVILLALFL